MRIVDLCRSLLILGIMIISVRFAHAQTTTSETLTFENNQMPSGWNFYLNGGSNLTIQNNRLEIGATSTYGGITKSIDTNGISKIQIQYDSNIADIYYGQGSAAMISSEPLNWNTGTYAQLGMGKTDRGLYTMGFQASFKSTAGVGVVPYYEVVPPVFGNYHMNAIFENGQFSQTVTNLDTGATFSSGTLAVSGLLLSDMHNVALFGVVTNGESTWIDNATISITTAVPEPETYAMLLTGLGLIGAIGRRRRST